MNETNINIFFVFSFIFYINLIQLRYFRTDLQVFNLEKPLVHCFAICSFCLFFFLFFLLLPLPLSLTIRQSVSRVCFGIGPAGCSLNLLLNPSCHPRDPSACAIVRSDASARPACRTSGAARCRLRCSPGRPYRWVPTCRCDRSPPR